MQKTDKPNLWKGTAERHHFKSRMFARYGIRINDKAYRCLVGAIREECEPPEGMAVVFFRRNSINRLLYVLTVRNQNIVIVYDKMRRELVTALDQDAFELKEARNALPQLFC